MSDELKVTTCIFALWVILMLGNWSGCSQARKQAIQHNAAYYICDPKTGKTTFKWNDEK